MANVVVAASGAGDDDVRCGGTVRAVTLPRRLQVCMRRSRVHGTVTHLVAFDARRDFIDPMA